MKVLMFGWEFPPHISGGLGTACFGLTKHLSRLNIGITFVVPKMSSDVHGSHVKLISPRMLNLKTQDYEEVKEEFKHLEKTIEFDSFINPYMSEETYKEQIEVKKHKVPSSKVSVQHDMSGNYAGNLHEEVLRYAGLGKILGEREDFDIIHAHDWLTFLAGVEAKKVSKKPLIAHIHATEFDRSGANIDQNIYNIEKYGLEQADKVIAVSFRTKEMLVTKYGIPAEKIFVVHNGVEKTQPIAYDRERRPFAGEKIVLFLGRITMQKGPEYFVEAAKLVTEKIPNVRFLMAGAGDLTRKMIEKMASLKLADRFHFTGFLDQQDREKVFAMSDLYVMPSVSEPFGITPLEAMKYNIPVIISKQSGIAEVLNHVIKVDFWDTEKLASAIINLLEDETLSKSIGDKNRDALEKIDWDFAAKSVLQVYQDALLEMSFNS